ncbi:MAG: sigma-E factor regulatory protein RseB domain-containing protein [Candidatus Baltobacteraceae bacterium]
MRILRAAASVGLAVALLALPISACAKTADAFALLRSAIDAPNHVSFVGQMQSVQFGTSKSVASVFRVEHRAPDLTRHWYLAPQALYGDSIISRGDTAFNIDVKHDRVIVVQDDAIDDQVTLDDNIGLLTANYHAIMGPDGSVAGRPASIVILINNYTGQTGLRVWIDKQTKLVLQKETYATNGSISQQSRFEDIRYVTNLPSAIFVVPKTGYAVVRGADHGLPSNDLAAVVKTAGFQAHGPKYLPDGFLPVTGDVTDIKGVRTLHLLYSDGIRTLSLFQNATGSAVDMSRFKASSTHVRNHEAKFVEDGPTKLLAWQESDLHFALVGELSENELVKIAASVVP